MSMPVVGSRLGSLPDVSFLKTLGPVANLIDTNTLIANAALPVVVSNKVVSRGAGALPVALEIPPLLPTYWYGADCEVLRLVTRLAQFWALTVLALGSWAIRLWNLTECTTCGWTACSQSRVPLAWIMFSSKAYFSSWASNYSARVLTAIKREDGSFAVSTATAQTPSKYPRFFCL